MTDTVQKLLLGQADSDRPALLSGEQRWTWRELVEESTRRADALLGLLASGDGPPHVGVLGDNTPEMVMALCAGGIGGYVTVGINTTRRGEGLAKDVATSDCQVLLVDPAYAPLLEGLDLGGVQVVDTSSTRWRDLVGAPTPRAHREVETMDTFMLIFTSGTSGEPKAVQASNFFATISGTTLAERFELSDQDVCYVSMPLFHSNAVVAGFAPAVAAGAAIALAPRFSASSFLADVRRYGATYMNYVGKPLAYVLATPRRPDDADNPLRAAFGNEASERDQRDFAERFGCTVSDGFGSTECAVIVNAVPDMPSGSIGQPWDGVAVYDRETLTECPRAQLDANGRLTNFDEAVGELVNTQGGGMFMGYYNDTAATEERLAHGYYWSGDLAYRDSAGFVFLAGRTSDWLRVDGENLAAAPIEQTLLRHPAVNRVAVYALPDPAVGDMLVAAVVLNTEPSLDPTTFEAFLAAQRDLSPKAWPRYVRLADDLPSTATNKILKRELAAQGLHTTDVLWEREERGTAYSTARA